MLRPLRTRYYSTLAKGASYLLYPQQRGFTTTRPLLNSSQNKEILTEEIKKKTMWQKVKTEAVHYWHGTKLLGLEVRISTRLTFKMLKGQTLTRRENRQLRRTTNDIIRLVPFAVFLIVPFMELLLPVALKMFPNMLPSTFENKKTEEEKKKRQLKVRLEMAKFLQETIAESNASRSSEPSSPTAFTEFFRKVRMTGEQASTEDIIKVAAQFEDELTLDNLSRPQLVSICRYMNINAFGTDNFLRFQIHHNMTRIKQDDLAIQKEGIEQLTLQELNSACATRGIPTLGVSPGRLRDELAQWLDLHLNHRVPSTLLILSRAFSYTDATKSTPEDALRATFNSLPDNLVNEAELQVLELMGASTSKQKFDVLEQQEELIEDESEQEEKEEKMRLKELEEERKKHEIEHRKLGEKYESSLSDKEQDELQKELSKLRSKVEYLEQRAQLNEIKFHHEDYKELIERLKSGNINKSTMRLSGKLEKMLSEIDKELDNLEKKEEQE